MELAIIDNFIDLSFMAALFLAAQAEKKLDLIGKIIKFGMSDTYKVVMIGLVHAVIWVFLFHPEGVTIKAHIKIILTSYLAMVVMYEYWTKAFKKKYE